MRFAPVTHLFNDELYQSNCSCSHFHFLFCFIWSGGYHFNPASIPVIELELTMGGGSTISPELSNDIWTKYSLDFQEPSVNDGYTKYFSGTFAAPVLLFGFRKSYHNRYLEASRIRSSAGIVFGIAPGMQSQQRWERTTSVTIDSFTMVSNGMTYPNDSTTYESYYRTFSSDQAVIGISQRFQTSPARRLTFHFGIDVLYGFSVNKSVRIAHSATWSTTVEESNSTSPEPHFFREEQRSSIGPNVRTIDAQFPFELAIKPWYRKLALKSVMIGFVARPGVKWYAIDQQKGVMLSSWFAGVIRFSL